MNNDVIRLARKSWTRSKIKNMLKKLRIDKVVIEWIMTFTTRTLRKDLLIKTGSKFLPKFNKTILVYSITSQSVRFFVNKHADDKGKER